MTSNYGLYQQPSQANMPLSVLFNDLDRHYEYSSLFSTEKEFLEFLSNAEENRKKWEEADIECQRLQNELEKARADNSREECKIQEIRRHLETKIEAYQHEKEEKDSLHSKISAAKNLVLSYQRDQKLSRDLFDKFGCILAVLESGESGKLNFIRSPLGPSDTISESIASTDLSMTQSEDGLEDLPRSRRRSKRLYIDRPDMGQMQSLAKKTKFNRSSVKQITGTTTGDGQLNLITTVKTQNGVHTAKAILETIPSTSTMNQDYPEKLFIQPTAPPTEPSTASESESAERDWGFNSPVIANNYQGGPSRTPQFGRTLSQGGAHMTQRPHVFCSKTVIKPEICEPCGTRIKFSKTALKCKDCRATCHPECKDKVPLPCVAIGTPGSKHQTTLKLADCVPNEHPMVPGLIQHCINEIEVRGLTSIGLYRVPGTEKDVKELKERFLRGKGVPNLSKIDLPTICSCIKDFLKSLSEPLIGRWFWKDFIGIADISDHQKRLSEMDRIMQELPPPNQDTLSFVIIHLQRISESPEVKMPITNLAKVFGPTLVGYSSNELNHAKMLAETKKQQVVMEALLSAPSTFWNKYVYRPLEQGRVYNNGVTTRSKSSRMSTISSLTPRVQFKGKSRIEEAKRIYFTDESPPVGSAVMKTPRKRYFE